MSRYRKQKQKFDLTNFSIVQRGTHIAIVCLIHAAGFTVDGWSSFEEQKFGNVLPNKLRIVAVI